MLEFAKRGRCFLDLETRQAIEHGMKIGRGGMWLELTPEQSAKLKRSQNVT